MVWRGGTQKWPCMLYTGGLCSSRVLREAESPVKWRQPGGVWVAQQKGPGKWPFWEGLGRMSRPYKGRSALFFKGLCTRVLGRGTGQANGVSHYVGKGERDLEKCEWQQRDWTACKCCSALPSPSAGLRVREADGPAVIESQTWEAGLRRAWNIPYVCVGRGPYWVSTGSPRPQTIRDPSEGLQCGRGGSGGIGAAGRWASGPGKWLEPSAKEEKEGRERLALCTVI